MKVIDLIIKNDISYDITLNVSQSITDIGDLVYPPAVIGIDLVINNMRVNHSVSAENIIVADTSELTVAAE